MTTSEKLDAAANAIHEVNEAFELTRKILLRVSNLLWGISDDVKGWEIRSR